MPEVIDELFGLHGAPTTTSANDPLPLIDPGAVWLVTRGHVDIVAMTIMREAGASVERTHLMRVERGELLFGFRPPPAGHNVLLLGYGSADARVSRLPVAKLAEAAAEDGRGAEIVEMVDRWVTTVCELCSGDLPPSGARNIRPGSECELEEGQSAQPQTGVLWLRPSEGTASFMGHESSIPIDEGVYFPLGKDAWLTARGGLRLTPHTAETIIDDDAYWRGLDAFQNTVDAIIDIQRTRARTAAQRRLIEKSEADRQNLDAAFSDLESILRRRRRMHVIPAGATPLLSACQLVGERIGIEVRDPGRADRSSEHANPLETIAKVSRFAFRRVRLTDGWHREDAGPLLGFRADGEPVALLPTSATTYEVHDVVDATVTRATPEVVETLSNEAFMFYRSLPDRPLRGLDLLLFGLRNIKRDLGTVLLIGAAAGMLTLVLPVAIGHVFDTVVPGAERGQLLQVVLGLIVAGLASGAFQVTRNIALIRVQHRAGASLQAAVWDRVINLPAKFFRGYSAGDLGVRAMGIDNIMEQLSTSAVTSIVSGIFSLFSVALLFYYSPLVAVAAVGLVLLLVLITVACGVSELRYQRAIQENHGKIASMLLQFMNGIAKIRVAAAEDRAFAQWAFRFAEQTRLKLGARTINNNLDVVVAAFPVVTYMVIFSLVMSGDSPEGRLSTGAFLAFVSAFTTMLFGMMDLGTVAVDILTVVPVYNRLKPVLEATPEVDFVKADPGTLRGRIEVSNLSFRYETGGSLILDDVGFHADPGEFVALVGPSGSGKSTLLRILLGFEKPESGSIAYDGFDASGLDPRSLRRQLGVVLQDGALLPGDIFSNIVGSAVDLTINDAWEAARLAGLAEDIEEMPMGMHTVISEGMGTLSGGQRQRLMIAQSLDRLRATRIVIAHRLSTIENADRIYVLEGGRMVQSGTYRELVDGPGTFHDLVKRQIA
jgi:ATP-binding cassette subfamily C protein